MEREGGGGACVWLPPRSSVKRRQKPWVTHLLCLRHCASVSFASLLFTPHTRLFPFIDTPWNDLQLTRRTSRISFIPSSAGLAVHLRMKYGKRQRGTDECLKDLRGENNSILTIPIFALSSLLHSLKAKGSLVSTGEVQQQDTDNLTWGWLTGWLLHSFSSWLISWVAA